MANLIVHGGTPLTGRIVPSANKNAVLPILCATLLTREPVRLLGIPEITDVRKILDIFRTLGSDVSMDYATGVLDLHHRATQFDPAVHRLPEEMRSSIMLVPPLLLMLAAYASSASCSGSNPSARVTTGSGSCVGWPTS